ncbi:MAG: molecular chaperone DnaK [bacterium]|nr:molecular chaperone DnaK [bacterium]
MKEKPAIGIDLGTTNSCVALAQGNRPEVIPNRSGSRITPSFFAVGASGEVLIGHPAKRQGITNPRNTIHGVKRLVGRKFSSPEVQDEIKNLPYQLLAGPNDETRIQIGNEIYSPEEISAFILKEMRKIASEFLGAEVREAVVTVPAFFTDAQRQGTRNAGRIAGLDILRIINEPTAAALAYSMGRRQEETIAVYDWGGGTFDISTLVIGPGVVEVLSTYGDSHLGGEDIDNTLVQFLLGEFQDIHQADISGDPLARQRLKEAAEKAKVELSERMESKILLPFLATGAKGPQHLEINLHRNDLEEMSVHLVRRTIDICAESLALASLKAEEIDHVILVGGQSRMPMVRRELEKFFGKPPVRGVNPDEVVALGAAIQAQVLQTGGEGILLLDLVPRSLGIATYGGHFSSLIKRGTRIPTSTDHTFTTPNDNQTAVEINLLQGESAKAAENELLGKFILSGIEPAPRGVPRVEVKVAVDADGIVRVEARDQASGRSRSLTVTSAHGLTEEDIARMAKTSDRLGLADKKG